MDIPSPLNIKRIFRPENIWDRIYGWLYAFCLPFVFVHWVLPKITGSLNLTLYQCFFISIMLVGGLWFYYAVYAKRKEYLKEIYESYYSLIIHTDPYWGKLRFLLDIYDKKTRPLELTMITDTSYFEDDKAIAILYPRERLPEYFRTAVIEVCRSLLTNYASLFIDIKEDPSLLHISRKHSTINALFKWHIDKGHEIDHKGIPLLSTDDGKPIRDTNDLRRLWEEVRLKSIATKDLHEFSDAIKGIDTLTLWKLLDGKEEIENHLRDKHSKNLMRLSDC